MKAVAVSDSDQREILIEDMNIPVPRDNEILVRVHAAGLNPVDYKVAASGHPAWTYPFTLGLDVAGTVVETGKFVTHLSPGDRVFYHGDLSKPGGFAEYAVTTAHTVSKIPGGITFSEAAALPCSGLTAYQALYRKIDMSGMESILIHGGAGGVGGFAIQLAKRAGLMVITTCSPENNDWVAKLGADFAIDYKNEDVTLRVMEITDGQGVNAILNTLGAESAQEDILRLSYNGHLICIADLPDLSKVNLWSRAMSVHTIALGGAHGSGNYAQQRDLANMATELIILVSIGGILPMIESRISLEEIPEAFRRLATRHARGKIVAEIIPDDSAR